jgi:hypothetical protein
MEDTSETTSFFEPSNTRPIVCVNHNQRELSSGQILLIPDASVRRDHQIESG